MTRGGDGAEGFGGGFQLHHVPRKWEEWGKGGKSLEEKWRFFCFSNGVVFF